MSPDFMDTKCCTKCDEEKEISEFWIRKSRAKNGGASTLSSWCKKCTYKNTILWRNKNSYREPKICISDEVYSCKNGHFSQKDKYGQCIECVRENTRNWAKKNQKYKAEQTKNWRINNPEKYFMLKKNTNEKRKNSSEEEKDIIRQRNREWQKNNPDLIRKINRIRVSFKRNSTPKWANKKLITRIYNKCPEGMQVDHIIPTKGKNVCGLHVETNLQYLSPEENGKKFNSFDGTEFNGGSPVLSAPTWINKADLKPTRVIHDPRNGSLMEPMFSHLMAGNFINVY